MIRAKRLIVILFLLTFTRVSHAHVYQYINTFDPELLHSLHLEKQEYIRIVEHPEMKGYFSYGLCEKIITDYQSAEPNHIHDKCITPLGNIGGYFMIPTETIPDNPYRPTFLIDLWRKTTTGMVACNF
ncbi:MAG: hypothetical protein R2877_03205 [Bdellovibrionota bacterium]